MSIQDALTILSGTFNGTTATGQDLAQAAGNYLSTNTYDLGVARDVGKGEPFLAEFVVTTAFTSGGSATVQLQIVQADNEALSTNLEVLAQTAAIPIASLTLGMRINLDWPRVEPYSARRYIGARYVIAVATTTAGRIFCSLVKNAEDRKTYYASGFAVL
jgi:hypothetical protein